MIKYEVVESLTVLTPGRLMSQPTAVAERTNPFERLQHRCLRHALVDASSLQRRTASARRSILSSTIVISSNVVAIVKRTSWKYTHFTAYLGKTRFEKGTK
jgi:hypothetical protein